MSLKTDAVPLVREVADLSLTNSRESTSSRLAATNVSSDRLLPSYSNNSNSSEESSNSSRRNYSDYSSQATTATCYGDTAENSYRRLTESSFDEMEERRWQSVNHHLKFPIEGNSREIRFWKKLVITLYEKIEDWRKLEILSFKPSIWDFAVIHTDDEIDSEIIQEFMHHLDLEGLIGISLANLGVDENKIEVSAKILNGSTKIFVLNSIAFLQSGLHHLQYQESLMKRLHYQNWKRKLIPLHPSPRDVLRYKEKYPMHSSSGFSIFGLASIQGITLGDRARTIRKVRSVLTTDIQEMNDARRRSEKETFIYAIDCIKEKKCEDLRRGLIDLKRQLDITGYSAEYLANIYSQLCIGCENLSLLSSSDSPEQVILLENCREVSIGPSFNFNVRLRNDEESSDI